MSRDCVEEHSMYNKKSHSLSHMTLIINYLIEHPNPTCFICHNYFDSGNNPPFRSLFFISSSYA